MNTLYIKRFLYIVLFSIGLFLVVSGLILSTSDVLPQIMNGRQLYWAIQRDVWSPSNKLILTDLYPGVLIFIYGVLTLSAYRITENILFMINKPKTFLLFSGVFVAIVVSFLYPGFLTYTPGVDCIAGCRYDWGFPFLMMEGHGGGFGSGRSELYLDSLAINTILLVFISLEISRIATFLYRKVKTR